MRAARDRVLLPEARSGREQWRRPLIEAVDRHISRLGPAERTAAEISGHDHAGKGWRSFESLNYPEFDLCAQPAGRVRGGRPHGGGGRVVEFDELVG